MDTSLEKMAKLAPAFKKDGGTVTAGNASGINDGAAAVVVMAADKAKALGLKPLARIKGYAAAAWIPPTWGSVRSGNPETPRHARLTMKDIDLVELNEAFACQAIACMRELSISWDKCNLNGSGSPSATRWVARGRDHLQSRYADAEKRPEPGPCDALHRRRPGDGHRPGTGVGLEIPGSTSGGLRRGADLFPACISSLRCREKTRASRSDSFPADAPLR